MELTPHIFRSASKIFLVACALLTVAPAADKERKPRKAAGTAVIAGTVFREPGLALAGAEISLDPDADYRPEPPAADAKPPKVKPMKIVSDGRGEFAFHVPAAPMRYYISVKAAGWKPDRKTITIAGEERQDVYFNLEAAASK